MDGLNTLNGVATVEQSNIEQLNTTDAHVEITEDKKATPASNDVLMSIDEVLIQLKEIVSKERAAENPKNALFATLYLYVTAVVKATILGKIKDSGKLKFEDNKRMENLDVIFAKRYIDAYNAYKNGQPLSESWKRALGFENTDAMIPLQNILMGINAHINLDLGIATSEAVRIAGDNPAFQNDMMSIKGDFNTINVILNKLTKTVEKSLAQSSILLQNVIKYGKDFESKIAGFSIEVAREAAWTFALETYVTKDLDKTIKEKDAKVANYAKELSQPSNGWIQFVVKIMKMLERKSTGDVVDLLLKDLETGSNIKYSELPDLVAVEGEKFLNIEDK